MSKVMPMQKTSRRSPPRGKRCLAMSKMSLPAACASYHDEACVQPPPLSPYFTLRIICMFRPRVRFVSLQPGEDDPGVFQGYCCPGHVGCDLRSLHRGHALSSPAEVKINSACSNAQICLSKSEPCSYNSIPAWNVHAADAIDDEIPGSVRAYVEPLVLDDAPFNPHKTGGELANHVHISLLPLPPASFLPPPPHILAYKRACKMQLRCTACPHFRCNAAASRL